MPTTNYTWDPLNDSYLMETDENGATTAVYTQEPAMYGELVSQWKPVGISYFHQDNLGSTCVLTGENESVTDTFTYDAWGNELARSGTTETSFRWVGARGYYFDIELAGYYIRARNYRPTIARWLSFDPAGFADGINRFTLRFSLRYIDPSGRKSTRRYHVHDIVPEFGLDPARIIADIEVTVGTDSSDCKVERAGKPLPTEMACTDYCCRGDVTVYLFFTWTSKNDHSSNAEDRNRQWVLYLDGTQSPLEFDATDFNTPRDERGVPKTAGAKISGSTEFKRPCSTPKITNTASIVNASNLEYYTSPTSTVQKRAGFNLVAEVNLNTFSCKKFGKNATCGKVKDTDIRLEIGADSAFWPDIEDPKTKTTIPGKDRPQIEEF